MRDVNGSWSPRAVLTIGAAAAVVFVLSPDNSAVQIVAWFVPLVMAVVLHTRRYRKGSARERRPLGLLLAGVVGYLAASLVWYIPPTVLEIALPFPSPLDLAYFTVYSIYAGFLLVVIRRQRSTDLVDSRLALIDALILTAAMSTIAWEAVIEHNLDVGASGLVTTTALAYPAFTVLLFGLGVRLAITSGIRNGAGVLMVLWIGAEVTADVVYGHEAASGSFVYGTPCRSCGWCRARASRRWGSTRRWTTCSAGQAGASPDVLRRHQQGPGVGSAVRAVRRRPRPRHVARRARGPTHDRAGVGPHLRPGGHQVGDHGRRPARATSPCRRAEERERSEVRLPGDHEPRDPHPPQRRDGDDRAPARLATVIGAEGLRGDHPPCRGQPALRDQRHPRLLEDRSRAPRPGGPAVRACSIASSLPSTWWRPQAAAKDIHLAYLVQRDCPRS